MATNITLVALAQMVDIALNINEGVINFQAMHTLLHVVIQQLNLNDVAIEFRGDDSDHIQKIIATIKPGSQLYPEYAIIGPKGKKSKTAGGKKHQISLNDIIKEHTTKEEKKEKEIRVIERRKDSREDPEPNPLPLKSPPGSLLGITPADLQTVVVIESQAQLPQYSVALSKTVFDTLQNDVEDIKSTLREFTDLGGSKSKSLMGTPQGSSLAEMFNVVNLTKRMDAAEMVLEQLGSLMADLATGSGSANLAERLSEVVDPKSGKRGSTLLLERVAALEKAVQELSKGELTKGGRSQSIGTPDNASRTTEERVSAPSDVASVTRSRKSGSKGDQVKLWMPQTVFSSVIESVDLSTMPSSDALQLIQQEFQNLKSYMSHGVQEIDRQKVFGTAEVEINTEVIDEKFKEYGKKMEDMNTLYKDQIGQLYEQFTGIQDEMNDVLQKMNHALPGGDSTGIDAETTLDLANKLVILEREIVAVGEQAAKLREDQEEQDKQTETILEQIDVLKIVKANREDLEDALGDKADACMINRKVSHDQFDAACDDLTRGIEEALAKLEEQEDMWREALDTMQREVGNKLDKNEVDPIREFVNAKLKALQEKFKSLAALKKEHEAAGTKTRFLRNVNCISCDKEAVMRREMDPSLKPPPYAMPPTRSMAPYLAYELDQLRKQQKCTPGSKNLNYIETALKGRTGKEKDHICNRYCGGSHTVTTPQQRVTRLGHFLEQWGPEIAPLNDEYIRGKDNQMYKARDDSLYKKTGAATEGKKEAAPPKVAAPGHIETEEPVHDQDTMVTKMVEEAAAKEAKERQEEGDKRKKVQNIGATPLENRKSSSNQLVIGNESETSGRGSPKHSHVRVEDVKEVAEGKGH